jgi:hypothetical protein
MSEGEPSPSIYLGRLGRAFHAVMAIAAMEGREEAIKHIKAEALKEGVKPIDLDELITKFNWDPSEAPVVGTEMRVKLVNEKENLTISGIIDLIMSESMWKYEIVDYKTTYRWAEEPEPNEHLQMLAYGLALWDEKFGSNPDRPKDAEISLTLAFARLGSEKGWAQGGMGEFEAEEARDVIWSVARKAAKQYELDEERRDYQTGSWCQWCRGKSKCPALTADLRGALNLVGDDVTDVTPENAMHLHALRKSMSRFESALKKRLAELITETGPISGSKKVLEFRSQFRVQSLTEAQVQAALRRCGADPTFTQAVMQTINLREKQEVRRLDLYRPRED